MGVGFVHIIIFVVVGGSNNGLFLSVKKSANCSEAAVGYHINQTLW